MKQETWENLSKSCKFLAWLVVFENLLDCIFTYIGLTFAGGRELNPLMDYLIQHGWIYFFTIKMSLVSFFSYILYLVRQKNILIFLACIYTALVLYYLLAFVKIFLL